MSLCQPEQGSVSCGSCCGLFNLDLDRKGYRHLLQERTGEFNESVDFKTTHTIPAYRQSREKKESHLIKKDDTTYNCPFLGYLDSSETRIGCLIHPVRTGDPKSQNFSFYGSSICLGYECKNKERPTSHFWKELFSELAEDSLEYSQYSANHVWVRRLENAFSQNQPNPADLERNRNKIREIWIELSKNLPHTNLTSFEVDYETEESAETSLAWLEEMIGRKIQVH